MGGRLVALLAALALATLPAASASPRLSFPESAPRDAAAIAAEVHERLGVAGYTLGTVTVSQNATARTTGGVAVSVLFQNGTWWNFTQPVEGTRADGSFEVAPDHLQPGVEVGADGLLAKAILPAPAAGTPADVAETTAEKLGIPANATSSWTVDNTIPRRVLSALTATGPAFYLACGCTTLVRHDAGFARNLNIAYATFDERGRLVLFETSAWLDLRNGTYLAVDEAQREADHQLRPYHQYDELAFQQTMFDGTRVLYRFQPRDAMNATLSDVDVDAETGKVVAFGGPIQPTGTLVPSTVEPDGNTTRHTVPTAATLVVVAAACAAAGAIRRRRT